MKCIGHMKEGFGVAVCGVCSAIYKFESKDVFANVEDPECVNIHKLTENDIQNCKHTIHCGPCNKDIVVDLNGVAYSEKVSRNDFLKEVLKASKPRLFRSIEYLEDDDEDDRFN